MTTEPQTSWEAAEIRLNLRTWEVHYQDRPIELRRKEFLLLKTFLEHPGRVFSRDELLDLVWGYDAYPVTRTVDNHVLQLRKKIAGHLFETLHGVGYRFAGIKSEFPTVLRCDACGTRG